MFWTRYVVDHSNWWCLPLTQLWDIIVIVDETMEVISGYQTKRVLYNNDDGDDNSGRILQNIVEYCRILQNIVEYCRIL